MYNTTSKIMKRLTTLLKLAMVALIATVGMVACDDEPAVKAPLAFFSAEPSADNSQMIIFTNESDGGDTYSWDFGDGMTSTDENPSNEYAAAGQYTVKLTATNAGGSDTHEEVINVTSAAGIEYVVDGDMTNADAWTSTALNLTVETTYTFENEAVTITNGNEVNQSNGAFYQAIDVKAGDYLFSMDLTNDGTQVQTWLEVYFGSVEPASGDDYSDGGMMSGISSWPDNCEQANSTVNIITVGCKGELDESQGGNGVVTFDEDQTIYLVIKAGSWDGNMTTGYIIDNVSLISQ